MYGEANETREVKIGTGARADGAERASGCHERRSNLVEAFERPSEAHTRKPVLRTNHATGMKFWDGPRRRPLAEVKLKFDVPALRLFPDGNGVTATFEWITAEPVDESDAIDAQCRAGWPDTGYGFYKFQTSKLEDGTFCSVWKAGVSCE